MVQVNEGLFMSSVIWTPEETPSRGYVDVPAELIVELSKTCKTTKPRQIAVTSDPLPVDAKVHKVVPLSTNDIRIELDGVESRQYRPTFEERNDCDYPRSEIENQKKREAASNAIYELLYAMDLEMESRIVLPDGENSRKLELLTTLGKLILGDDCPCQMKG